MLNLSGTNYVIYYSVHTLDDDAPIIPSGITTRYTLGLDDKLKDVEIYTAEGNAFDMDKVYSVVMNDYMATVYIYDHQDPGQGLFRPTAETTIEYLEGLKSIPSYRGLNRVEVVRLTE